LFEDARRNSVDGESEEELEESEEEVEELGRFMGVAEFELQPSS